MCFSPYLGIKCVGGQVTPKGLVRNLLVQFFALGILKIQVSKTYFFDMVTTHNDHPSYVKHVLGSIYVFFTGFTGSHTIAMAHNLLMQFLTLGISKIQVSKTYFLIWLPLTMTIQASFSPYLYVFLRVCVCASLGCALLRVVSLRSGLAEGNRMGSTYPFFYRCLCLCHCHGHAKGQRI